MSTALSKQSTIVGTITVGVSVYAIYRWMVSQNARTSSPKNTGTRAADKSKKSKKIKQNSNKNTGSEKAEKSIFSENDHTVQAPEASVEQRRSNVGEREEQVPRDKQGDEFTKAGDNSENKMKQSNTLQSAPSESSTTLMKMQHHQVDGLHINTGLLDQELSSNDQESTTTSIPDSSNNNYGQDGEQDSGKLPQCNLEALAHCCDYPLRLAVSAASKDWCSKLNDEQLQALIMEQTKTSCFGQHTQPTTSFEKHNNSDIFGKWHLQEAHNMNAFVSAMPNMSLVKLQVLKFLQKISKNFLTIESLGPIASSTSGAAASGENKIQASSGEINVSKNRNNEQNKKLRSDNPEADQHINNPSDKEKLSSSQINDQAPCPSSEMSQEQDLDYLLRFTSQLGLIQTSSISNCISSHEEHTGSIQYRIGQAVTGISHGFCRWTPSKLVGMGSDLQRVVVQRWPRGVHFQKTEKNLQKKNNKDRQRVDKEQQQLDMMYDVSGYIQNFTLLSRSHLLQVNMTLCTRDILAMGEKQQPGGIDREGTTSAAKHTSSAARCNCSLGGRCDKNHSACYAGAPGPESTGYMSDISEGDETGDEKDRDQEVVYDKSRNSLESKRRRQVIAQKLQKEEHNVISWMIYSRC